jgi:hypothetical protein
VQIGTIQQIQMAVPGATVKPASPAGGPVQIAPANGSNGNGEAELDQAAEAVAGD